VDILRERPAKISQGWRGAKAADPKAIDEKLPIQDYRFKAGDPRLAIQGYRFKAGDLVFELDRRHLPNKLASNFKSATGGGMM
jgi:hypothetical protein